MNPGNMDFQKALNSEIYIDKSLLIQETSRRINTEQCYICVSRPRRFGKSMAANMLTAYYSAGCGSIDLFQELKISQAPDFRKHLNQYNVIHFNMQTFLNPSRSMSDMVALIEKRIGRELKRHFSYIDFSEDDLIFMLQEIYSETEQSFIFIIDEWDCIFRTHKRDVETQKQYLDFLQNLLKGQTYVALAYMTGILPIKNMGNIRL